MVSGVGICLPSGANYGRMPTISDFSVIESHNLLRTKLVIQNTAPE